ncbi:MAG TPA: sigma-54-dependent Fis family transcriptional regulator [Holophaga sp.]|nr:sigma-54-dependent Fis family transcriptional regulator [Holophaga sp.]
MSLVRPPAPIGSLHSKSERLERRLSVERAWQEFLAKGIVPAGVGEVISNSWLRTKEAHRLDPGALQPAYVESGEALLDRCRCDEVFGIVQPVLRDFAGRLDLADHALAYFDKDGWMLSIEGDPRIIDGLEATSFRPGTNWAEGSAGTNGPGTSLAEGRPVEVFASEHYVELWQQWSCAAAPIRIAGSPEPIGIVDLTGPWDVRRRQALMVVQAIARAIQERIQAALSVRTEVVRYAFRAAHEAGDALLAVDTRGRVIAMNDAANRRRLLESASLPPGLREAVSQAFRHAGQGEVALVSPDGQPITASIVRHENTAVGAILRLREAGRSVRVRRPAAPSARYDFSDIHGQSGALGEAVRLARVAAGNELPVILCGESGTGKELFAHSIHASSRRQAGPFVAVNCGGLPQQLIEAELFGYEAGAFTGAKREGNTGRCELADGGTLFLDEISELPLSAQTALLRVLQEREVVRLGGFTPRPVDVRIVAATNKPLEEEIRMGRFREDLYYRLNVLSIAVPPLRERKGDAILLAGLFLAEAESALHRSGLRFSPEALESLDAYPWPGNIRELKNVVMRAAATSSRPVIEAQDLMLPESRPAPAQAAPPDPGRTLDRAAILSAIEANAWNFAKAARSLGISRMTLYRWSRKHAISR